MCISVPTYNFQIILHLLMKLGINGMTLRFILLLLLRFHATNIMNMTAVQSYGI